MSKKKEVTQWNPDSARRSFKVAKPGSQTDLNSSKNQRKIRLRGDDEDTFEGCDFGLGETESTLKIDREMLNYAFREILD